MIFVGPVENIVDQFTNQADNKQVIALYYIHTSILRFYIIFLSTQIYVRIYVDLQ